MARQKPIPPIEQECFEILERYAPGAYDRREIWDRLEPYITQGVDVDHLELEPLTVTVQHIKGTPFYLRPVGV